MRHIGAALIAASLAACARTPDEPGRAALARLDGLLQENESATRALHLWCAERDLARPVAIRAGTVRDDGPAPAEARLAGPTRHRHTTLSCGRSRLAVADLWYRPGAIPPAMERVLETTTRPFGQVVGSLRFHREARRHAVLWREGPPPPWVIAQSARLLAEDGTPIGFVRETVPREAVLAPAGHR